jgi:hypothetical protein
MIRSYASPNVAGNVYLELLNKTTTQRPELCG